MYLYGLFFSIKVTFMYMYNAEAHKMSKPVAVKPVKPSVDAAPKSNDVAPVVVVDAAPLSVGQPTADGHISLLASVENLAVKPVKKGGRKPRAKAADAASAAGGDDTKSVVSETPSQIERKRKNTPIVSMADNEAKGIIIQPNKVKGLVRKVFMDPLNYEVLRRIGRAAENTEDGKPAPVEIHRLPGDVLKVIQQAESEYKNGFVRAYERVVVGAYDDTKKKAYSAARKLELERLNEARRNSRSTELGAKQEEFNNERFNKMFDPHFYDGFEAYYATEDKFAVGKLYRPNVRKAAVASVPSDTKTPEATTTAATATPTAATPASSMLGDAKSPAHTTVDEWMRAAHLIKRRIKRLGSGVSTILAAFLDYLVMALHAECIQIAYENGGDGLVKLEHVIHGINTSTRQNSVMQFVATLNNLRNARDYVNKMTKADNSRRTTLMFEKPASYVRDFATQISDLSMVVRKRLGANAETDIEKHAHSCKMSASYKVFLGCIVYETISRISQLLSDELAHKNLRTVSSEHAWGVIRQIHRVCGMSFDTASLTIASALTKYFAQHTARKQAKSTARFNARKNTAPTLDAVRELAGDDPEDEDSESESDAEHVTDPVYEDEH